ncbi:uncharacterized protein LOC125237537 [Leguminivora glycinivorella]|uniref:uncharacterized protein LOC125237537 n=1 Tax=Leguminivora glycinivorella TaxID=1035111 RepID=UPI00200DC654|nr:uncharacterized protein LOC125237537 [Leguminivora glycinivorella]
MVRYTYTLLDPVESLTATVLDRTLALDLDPACAPLRARPHTPAVEHGGSASDELARWRSGDYGWPWAEGSILEAELCAERARRAATVTRHEARRAELAADAVVRETLTDRALGPAGGAASAAAGGGLVMTCVVHTVPYIYYCNIYYIYIITT